MRQVRLAVIGTGHLGKIHARLAKGISAFKVVGVVDPAKQARDAFCKEYKLKGYDDVSEISSKIDAAVIATPTLYHKEVAAPLLEQGKHVLVEKPVGSSLAEIHSMMQVYQQHHYPASHPRMARRWRHSIKCGAFLGTTTFTSRS